MKNICTRLLLPKIKTPIKTNRAMKLTCALLLTASMGVFATGNAQTMRVNIQADNVSTEKILSEIEKQTDYLFVYNKNEVDLKRKTSVNAVNKTTAEVLSTIFNGTDIIYAIEGENIMLMRKEKNLAVVPDAVQQDNKITGTVLDPTGMPVIGANIMVKGTTNGTITDMDGKFSLEAREGAVLVVSYIGFANQEIKIGKQKQLSIALKEDSQALDELVVVGYGTLNKQAITGAVVKADIEEFKHVPTNNILETVKGALPGLNVGGTNRAGQVADFTIRGQNSTGASNTPLVVIDNVIYNGSLADIPSEDIESFTVLKDASAAAVYGSRSANGVILIQTKRGRSNGNKPDFNVNLSYGITNELNRPKIYDGEGYLQRLLDTREALGLDHDPEKVEFYLQDEERKNYLATPEHKPTFDDPYGVFTQNARNMKANLSISNSSEMADYYISASLTDQKGVILNDDYKNFSGRININSNLTSWLKVGVKANYSLRDYSGASPSMYSIGLFSPYASLYDENGDYLQYPQSAPSFQSPYWGMATTDLEKYNTLRGILDVNIKCPWIEGLSYSLVYSNDVSWDERASFYNKKTTAGLSSNGKGSNSRSRSYNMLFDNLLKYNHVFDNKHAVDVTLLYSRERGTWNSVGASAEDFDNVVLDYNGLYAGKKQMVSTTAGSKGAIAMMARATYTFDNRYSITGTVRRDGFSGFSKNKKWGTFASAGLNWNLKNERFLKDVDVVSNLALRVSYGSNGNQSITPYLTLAKMGTDKYIFAGATKYNFVQAIRSFALDNLGWETTTGTNLGIDFSLWNNRLSGNIDTYFTSTKNLLFDLKVPNVSGTSALKSNIGNIKNRGFEIGLHSLNIDSEDFTWTSDFAFSLNRNIVASIYGEDNDGDGKEDDLVSSGYFIGKSLGTIYTYKVIGTYQQEDLDNGTIMEGMRPGDYILEDVNQDGKMDSQNDRQFLGTTKENFRWSLTNTLRYKDFSLMIFINSVWGGNGYFLSGSNAPYNDLNSFRGDMNYVVYDYWTPRNTDAEYPRLDYCQNARYRGTKYMDRSYIKLQKMSLTYDLARLVKPLGFHSMSLSLSADNLLTFAPYWDGLDPETNQGLSLGGIPSLRTYQMTLLFNF